MPVLHNRVSNEMLKARMLAETEPRTTISFYKYFTIDDPQATRDALYQAFTALNVFGRVYLAREGINAQISVPESKVSAFRDVLYQFDPALDGLRLNIALDDDGKSFWVLRMKVRERIVADGIDDPAFNAADVGEYLKAAEVNAMLDDPDAVPKGPSLLVDDMVDSRWTFTVAAAVLRQAGCGAVFPLALALNSPRMD